VPEPEASAVVPVVETVMTSPTTAVPPPNARVTKDAPGIWTVAADTHVAP
jgi:hypothetical protein